jgi:hypothetical protein
MQLLFSVLMDGRPVSHIGIISDLSHSHVEILKSIMMFDIPVRSIRSIHMQLYADLENIHSLLPVEVVVTDKSSQRPFEIMKPVLVVTTVISSPSVPVTFINHNLRLDRLSPTLFRNLKSFWKDSLITPNSPAQVSISQVSFT